jgi:glycosyltransferase involved in cell wall biosynthesis
MSEQPLVSISCITYNHAPFLRKCLDSFLSQVTTFPFEVVIHDDASTDGTQDIILEYCDKYPGVFFPLLQKENQYSKGVRGMMAKFNFPRCRGKYIALCEGDDYWTDIEKLQKQVDVLETNPEVVLAGHDAMIINQNGELVSKSKLPPEKKRNCSSLELQKSFYVLTQSMCFRNLPFLKNMPPESFKSKMGDVFLISMLGQFGSFRYMPEIKPTAYRIHEKGIWGMKNEAERIMMMHSAFVQLSSYYGRIKDRRMELYHAGMVLENANKLFKLEINKAATVFQKSHAVYKYLISHFIFQKPLIVIKLYYMSLFRKQ